jgi:hypothetical protein
MFFDHHPTNTEIENDQQTLVSVPSEEESFSPGKPTSISQSVAQQVGLIISQTGKSPVQKKTKMKWFTQSKCIICTFFLFFFVYLLRNI